MRSQIVVESLRKLFCVVLAAMLLSASASFGQDLLGGTDTEPQPIAETDTAPDTTGAQIDPDIKEAFELFKTQKFKDAEDKLKAACANKPELPPAGIILGQWHFRARQPAFARAAFERTVRDYPNDPEPYVVFGDNAINQRRFTDAVLLYERGLQYLNQYNANATRKKNLSLRAYGGVAAVYEAREQFDQAEAALNKVLQLDPANVTALARKGHVLFRKAKGKDAATAKKLQNDAYNLFKQVYDTDPNKMIRYELNMARLFHSIEDEARAEKLYALAMTRETEPEQATRPKEAKLQTHLAAAQWALETGRGNFAKSVAAKATQIDPEAVQVLLLQGVLNRAEGNHAAAETALRKAHAANPTNAIILNQLALAVGAQEGGEKSKQAIEFSQMAVQMFRDISKPLARETRITFAWLANKSGDKTTSQKLLKEALTAGPIGAEPAYFAAQILNDQGSPGTARRMLEKALEGKGLFPTRKAAETLFNQIPATAVEPVAIP